MNHNTDKYLKQKLEATKWENKELAQKSDISPSQISRFKKGTIQKLYASKFYGIVTAFEDNFRNASKIIYPNLKLNIYTPKKRNQFGGLMSNYETEINSLEQIAAKTGIEETRLSELYYRNGAPEAHELLLIEMAVGEKPGALFEKLYGEEFRKKVVEGIKEDENNSKK